MVERAGATTVSAVTLHEIVRKLPDGALVSFSDDGTKGRLTVEAGRSNFNLATLPKEDFPVMTSSEYTANFACAAPPCAASSTNRNSRSPRRRPAIT